MFKRGKNIIFLLIFLFNWLPFGVVRAAINLPAPTLIDPNEHTVTGRVKPLITGLTKDNTSVNIYIDGVYNGKTDILKHESGTVDFAYKPFLNLSVGRHTIWAVAEDKNGRKSGRSNILKFNIEHPFPAPTLFSPTVNSRTTNNKPFIVGLAKNNSLIKVFIDHRFFGQFRVKNHKSGTANFAYQPFLPLVPGKHLVYATAADSRGKESIWSNTVYFQVSQSIGPRITRAAVTEKNKRDNPDVLSSEFTAGDKDRNEKNKSEADIESVKVDNRGTKNELAVNSEMAEIKKLLKQDRKSDGVENNSGLIDESSEKQGKLKLNLIIFTLFLLAVIGWIFWVNRELIRERRALNKKKIKNI